MSSRSADLPQSHGAIAALLLAVDAPGLGGAILDHPVHEHASQFARVVQGGLPRGAPLRRVPASVTADRLFGGVDLAATLAQGRLIAERGVLASAHGGLVVVPMAERLSVAARTALTTVLDDGVVQVARDGISDRHDASIGVLLLDESVDDELVHPALRDRVAFAVRVDGRVGDELAVLNDELALWSGRVRDARGRLRMVTMDEEWIVALCTTADAFGVDSVRAHLLAVRCARAVAAIRGRLYVSEADAELAAALVLAPRATRIPMPPQDTAPDEGSDAPPPPSDRDATPPPDASRPQDPSDDASHDDADEPSDDDAAQPTPESGELLRAAVTAALPPGLLAQLLQHAPPASMSGRVGEETPNLLRGRPRGARSGLPRGGARLHLLETLRAAAPWQRVRAPSPRSGASSASSRPTGPLVRVRRPDFRIRRFIERTGTTVIFVVDASGSSALYRLAEAKGAVELLLAESYARRDRVALIAFRGQGTDVLLPPTRALARAKKVLAALPGGGGTPMAHAIETALEQGIAAQRAGSAPLIVMLTDGRANIARDGTPGRAKAEQDALEAGRRFAALRMPALFVDTSVRGEPMARRIAEAMQARYILLPNADAAALGGLVRTAAQLTERSG